MESEHGNQKRGGGIRSVVLAAGHGFRGMRHAALHDAAIRQALAGLAALVPVSVLLPLSDLEHLVLVLSMMQVVLMEFVNSAIESTVDRISLETHPLSGRAKDLASAAVGISVLMCGLCWLVIAGPVLMRWAAAP